MADFKYNLDRRTLANVIYDFKESDDESQKKEIIDVFCATLLEIQPHIQYRKKNVSFVVDECLPSELVELFKPYAELTYTHYNSSFRSHDPYEVLKQQLNKIFVKTCDKKICIVNDYIAHLSAPKRYYYLFRQFAKDDVPFDEIQRIRDLLSSKVEAAEQAKKLDEAWKLGWTYGQFMEFVQDHLYRIFTNYTPPPEIGADGAELIICDFADEDHYIVSYVWRSLYGYISLYRKKLFGLSDHKSYKLCPTCGQGVTEDEPGNLFCYRCRPKDTIKSSRHVLQYQTEEKQFEPKLGSSRPAYSKCEKCGENFNVARKGRIPKYCKSCKTEIERQRKRAWIAQKRGKS